MSFKPTEEQQKIIDLALEGEDLVINAFAGASKSTTLAMIAEAKHDQGGELGLYLAFNKAIAVEAEDKFPTSVDCRTVHSLAYRHTPKALKSKIGGRIFPKELAELLGFRGEFIVSNNSDMVRKLVSVNTKASMIKQTVARFCNSADETVEVKHLVKMEWMNKLKKEDFNFDSLMAEILVLSRSYWEECKDPNSPVPLEHDGYLKMYSLLKKQIPVSYIMIDENQDSSPVILNIIEAQKKAQKIYVGDNYQSIYCQPAGTKVKVVDDVDGIVDINIENLSVGDKVLSYGIEKSHLYKRGKKITKFGERDFSGKMVEATIADRKVKFTEDHECLVRFSDSLKGKFVVYLMECDDKFRIGIAPFYSSTQGGVFGFMLRFKAEKAKKLWILKVLASKAEARKYECLYSFEYSIPQYCFVNNMNFKGHHFKPEDFWSNIDLSKMRVKELLKDLGLSVEYPFYTSDADRIYRRSIYKVKALNLFKGMMFAKYSDELDTHGKLPKTSYVELNLVDKFDVIDMKVYSMNVEDTHTYFSEGFLTHNCWRGAINAMEFVTGEKVYLTKSFRFGDNVQTVANMILKESGCEIELKGNDSKVGKLFLREKSIVPNAVICRTNSGVIKNVFEYSNKYPNKIIGASCDLTAIQSFVKAYEDLVAGRKVEHQLLYAFENKGELMEYCDECPNDLEVSGMVKLIERFGAKALMAAMSRCSNQQRPDIMVTTAHKSKGLEWDNVILYNDFGYDIDESGELEVSSEEMNVIYVAATRAKVHLCISGIHDLLNLLHKKTGIKFEMDDESTEYLDYLNRVMQAAKANNVKFSYKGSTMEEVEKFASRHKHLVEFQYDGVGEELVGYDSDEVAEATGGVLSSARMMHISPNTGISKGVIIDGVKDFIDGGSNHYHDAVVSELDTDYVDS